MECQDCDNLIHDFMDAEVANEEERARAFEHIRRCARCEARFSSVGSLKRALRTLAETTDAEQSAAQLEPVLRTVFQQQKRLGHSSRPVASWLVIGMAAALLLSIGVVSRQLIFAPERRPTILATPVQAGNVSKAQIEPAATLAQGTRKHGKSRPRVPAQRRDGEEFVTGFYALPYAENSDRIMSGEVVRVKLRGSALPGIGFPMALNGDTTSEQVTADLIVGENGLPLAIRFVRSAF
jgi:hypothetical protein